MGVEEVEEMDVCCLCGEKSEYCFDVGQLMCVKPYSSLFPLAHI